MGVEQVVSQFASDAKAGLSHHECEARLRQYGRNSLKEVPPPPLWRKLARQFASVLVGILLVAGLISGVMGEWSETVAILAIVLLNAVIGFLQEERAEKALSSLRKLAAPTSRVTRDGHLRALPAVELVPGDLIHVESGDHVPTDARLLESVNLTTLESSLTGESTPVSKDAAAVYPVKTPLAERHNMVYAGTVIAGGNGRALVVATGMETELGHIAGMLERGETQPTPLQRRLASLGKHLALVCGLIIVTIFVLHVARGRDPIEVLLFAVSLAVAAVPEGLPAVVTIALALGVQRMVRRKALIRNLPSVETLGCVTVICTDKTGTLTRNEMTVREIWTTTGRFHVTGRGYSPEGEFKRIPSHGSAHDQTVGEPVDVAREPELHRALTAAAVCNNVRVKRQGDNTVEAPGDPTEVALSIAAMKAGIDAARFERLHEIPFDSERKAMSVIARDEAGSVAMYTKGAPEVIIERCTQVQQGDKTLPLSVEAADGIRRASAQMGERALRVLALASRPVSDAAVRETEEADMIFLGLAGMIDPPREEAAQAIEVCGRAGIRPVMITGDHPTTAMAVARELKLPAIENGVMTGAGLDELSDPEFAARAADTAVFARVAPEHKLKIVGALRARGDVTAMTGDGVNDAPALKTADIGIAMGRTGTDVTRGAADMVLMDDNFATIVAAVEEGRGIFDNIQKVTHYLLSCNAGELIFLFFAALAGWPTPLVAVHILWINLITDGVPALALGVERPERDIMKRSPRHPKEPLITRSELLSILVHGLLIAGIAAGCFAWVFLGRDVPLEEARTLSFAVMAFSQLFFAIGCRSRSHTMPEIGWFTNPSLFWAITVSMALQLGVMSFPMTRSLFKIGTLDLGGWATVMLLSLVPVTVIETVKIFRRAGRKRAAA